MYPKKSSKSLPKPYCVKCKRKRTCLDYHLSYDSRGKARLEGNCSVCNTKCFRYIKVC
jgi:hypothetical protein